MKKDGKAAAFSSCASEHNSYIALLNILDAGGRSCVLWPKCPMPSKKLLAIRFSSISITLLLLLLPCFIYGPHLRIDHLWYLDDHALIDPVFLANSWADYANAHILDVAPLRDFSYWLDRQFFLLTGVTVFHLHNALLWGFIVLLIYHILANYFFSRPTALLVALLVLVHPMFSLDILWASARKHLLAVAFTLLNTYAWCRFHQPHRSNGLNAPLYQNPPKLTKKIIAQTSLLYLAALNAWPIVILWPLWALVHRWLICSALPAGKIKSKIKTTLQNIFTQDIFLLSCLAIIALGMAYLNLHYFPHQGLHGKLHGISWASLAAFGQYFFNFIWPFKIAIGYPMATTESLIGISLGLFFAYLTFKIMPRRWWFSWAWYYFCSLAIVTLNLSHIYVSDTYHTGGGWILFAFSAYLIAAAGKAMAQIISPARCELALKRISVLTTSLALALIIFFSVYDFIQLKNWRNDFYAYQTSVRHQPDDGSNNEFFLLNWLHPTREDHFTCGPIVQRLAHWTSIRQGIFDPPQMPLLLINWLLNKIKDSPEPLSVKLSCLDALPDLPAVKLTKTLIYLRQKDLPPAQELLTTLNKIRLSPVDAPELQRLNLIYSWQYHQQLKNNQAKKRNRP